MENFSVETKSCCCTHAMQDTGAKKNLNHAGKTVRTLPSMLLSVVIAFFPKCPVCVAAYMSMFGTFSLANSPWVGWVFPVLLSFLVLHLVLLLKKSKKNGLFPFSLSLAGALIILCGRTVFDQNQAVLITGMLFILAGSLSNSFSTRRFPLTFHFPFLK